MSTKWGLLTDDEISLLKKKIKNIPKTDGKNRNVEYVRSLKSNDCEGTCSGSCSGDCSGSCSGDCSGACRGG